MLKKLRNYIGGFRAYNREYKQVLKAVSRDRDRLMGRIVRYVHSIEKGLSIESPRAEFGYEKILTLHGWIKEYLQFKDIDKTCVYMAADALESYCAYHKSIGVETDKVKEVGKIASELTKIKLLDNVEGIFGGIRTIKKSDQTFDALEVEKFFKSRHSVRQYSKEPVSQELINKALELAQYAPSACNRQAVRAYAINTDRFIEVYKTNLQGMGGFIENSDKVILITGKISSYEAVEYKQFIVSAGIFAGYLSLALHGLGLGACVCQQILRPNEKWEEFCLKNNIPNDEQIICLVVVGNMNEETVVPISNRFDLDKISRWL